MSVNQSRAERNQGQLRKPSRSGSSGQQRGFLGGSGGGGGGGISAPPHPPISTNITHVAPPSSISPSLPANRSYKKSGNGHGSQSRVNPESATSEAGGTALAATALRVVQNGPQAQAPVHPSEAPAPGAGKSEDMSNPRNAPRAIPKVPSSQSSAGPPSSVQPKGDASTTFTLQFGTINPGIVNGLQIPARTSSAPPNLDEQKRDKSFRAPSVLPMPSAPKQQHQQPPRKDIGVAHQPGSVEPRPVAQIKRDVGVPVPSAAVVNLPKSSVHPLSGMPMPMTMPFQPQQPQVPPQFGGPSPQMQSPNLVANSLQMPMSIPMGNAPQVAQQMFVPSVQPHFVQQQAMMHQGQGLGYAPPIGHQFQQQLGNLGMGIAPQFSQPQPNKPVGPRKTTVKITHPETHEELRLDKRTDSFKDSVSSGLRPRPNVIPQSQPIATYTAAQPMNYYPPIQQNSYNPSPLMFPTSVPLTSGQVPTSSQPPRYGYTVGQSGQHLSFMNSSTVNTVPGSKPAPSVPPRGISDAVNVEGLPASTSALASGQIAAKPSVASQGERAGVSSLTHHVVAGVPPSKAEAPKSSKTVADATVSYRRHTEISPDGAGQQLKSASEPLVGFLSATDTNSSAAAPVPSKQSLHPEALSASEAQAGDSGSSLSINDDKKRELVLRCDSSKDNKKKQSKKDVKNLQLHPQLDASSSKVAKSPLPGTTKGSAAGDIITQDGCTKTEDAETILTSDLAVSSACPSLKAENNSISEIRAIKPVECKVIPAASVLSGSDKETSLEGNATHSGISTEVVASTLDTVVKGTNSENLPTESGAVNTIFDRRVETVEDSTKFEASNASYQDPDDASACSSSTITDPVVPLQENDRVGHDKKVKTSDYAEVDSKPFSHSIEDIDSRDENLMKERNMKNDASAELTDSVTTVDRDILSADADKDRVEPLTTKGEIEYGMDVGLTDSGVALMPGPVSNTSTSVISQKLESKVLDSPGDEVVSATSLGQKEKSFLEASKPKVTGVKKKKRKEILSKADAAGTSDLYNAYKGPEEKPEVVYKSENVDSLTADTKLAHIDHHPDKDVIATKEDGQNKAELDDWENAADISTPKLKTSEHEQLADGERKQNDGGDETTGRKKYTRDFLMTLAPLFIVLPVGFEIGADIADVFMSNPLAKSPSPSSGRIIDRPSGGRRMVGNLDDDKWIRGPVPFGTGRDGRLEGGYGSAAVNHRPGQGATHGVLRNPRAHGGILSGPLQSMAFQGGPTRGGPDVDRWQRSKGLIPSPQMQMQVMHKAERKYEVGKVTDEEQAKQRLLKAILNKLTPQNFDKLFAQVNEVNIDNAVTLTGVISQIFDKALMEPTFCEMYANFCFHLAGVLPDFNEDNEKITFKRLLLNKCQEEFERGEREQAEANKVEEDGEVKQSEQEREEKRLQARRRMLGNIRLIGELYKKKMLTERIMHECIKKLLGQYQNPDEEDVEALCKLMSTIGEMIDHAKAKEHMDAYFEMMTKMSTDPKLSSRVRFMLRDSIDLRKNKWQQRRKVEGPKKIEEVHRDAAQERQAQSSRLGRGPVITNVPKRGQAIDYGSRSSAPLNSPNPQQVGGSRGLPSQARGFGTQDARMDDRHHFEGRTLSIPLPQRSTDEDYITLGPQGGLARGMSIRGHASISNVPPNGSSFKVDRVSGATHDQLSPRDRNNHHGSREKIPDRPFERSNTSMVSAGRAQGTSGSSVTVVESRTFSEEVLQGKSIQTIREFYSAKDENEVVLCIKELNAPNFYPSVISLWITDSFERKDTERDLLSKLIIDLCKPKDSLLNQAQLLRGFDSVLSSLEDAVNDAPKAPEFLGRLFAKIVMENVIPLREIGKLLHEGGEEPGSLREFGLAADVLGNILETIRSERGAAALNEILQANSNLRLKDFRPSRPIKSKLDAFL